MALEESLPTSNSSQSTLHDHRDHNNMAPRDEEKAANSHPNGNGHLDVEESEKTLDEPQQPQKPTGPPPPPNGGLVAWLHVLGGFMVCLRKHVRVFLS